MKNFKPLNQGAPQPVSAHPPANAAKTHLVTAPPSLIPIRQSPLLRHACSSACVSKEGGAALRVSLSLLHTFTSTSFNTPLPPHLLQNTFPLTKGVSQDKFSLFPPTQLPVTPQPQARVKHSVWQV